MEEIRFPIFRERFCKLRGTMTQEQFADFLGLSRPTVALYESGQRIPDALILKRIAEKCDVSADWLINTRDTTIRTLDETIHLICEYTGLREAAINTLHSSTYFHPSECPALQDSDVINYLLSDYGFMEDFMDALQRAFIASRFPTKQDEKTKNSIEAGLSGNCILLQSFEAVEFYINLALEAVKIALRQMMEEPTEKLIQDMQKGG